MQCGYSKVCQIDIHSLGIINKDYPVWLDRLTHLLREAQSHWPPFCFHSQLCKNDTRAAYQKLGCHEIEMNISSAYEN